MSECHHIRPHLADLVREGSDTSPPAGVREHLSGCDACGAELRVLREVWAELAPPVERRPAAELRGRVLARAREAVLEPQAPGVKGVIAELWRAVRPATAQLGAAVAASGAVVGLLHLGSGLAIRGHVPVLLLGLLLAALFGAALGGIRSERAVRAVLLGGLASVGGYLLLSVLHPIPRAVEFCQLTIFRDPAMPLGQACLVYAAVAALYAGLPVAVASRLSADGDGWAAGLAEGAVFTLLAAPILVLQFGVDSLPVTGTVLGGAAVGAAAGGLVARLPALRSSLRGALLLMASLGLLPSVLSAQALPFHTSTGITAGFNENAGRSFVTLLGRSGLVRDETEIVDPMDRDVDALGLVNGAILGGFTPQWTYRIIVPWVRKSMDFTKPDGRRARFDASGVGDAILQSKWIFFRDNELQGTTRLGIQGRVMVPLNKTDAKLPGGEVAPRELQVGNGSWDFEPTLIFTKTKRRLGFHANAGWRVNTGEEGFEAGDIFGYDAALGFRFVPWVYESLTDQSLIAYLELNGEVAREDRVGGVENPDSGGHVLFLSPDLQWVPTPWLLLEGSVQIPVVQKLNGTQLEHDVRFQIGTRFRFSVLR